MVASRLQFDLLAKRLNRYLGRKLEATVKTTLDSILENGNETSFKYKLEGKLKQSKRLTVLSMRTAYVDLFTTERDALQYVTTFFNTYSAVTVHNYLVKKRYYKTPSGGLVFIPRGEITDYSPNGGVFAFTVENRCFSWDTIEEIYYDFYNRVYNPYNEVVIGARTPRYIKEAYKHLIKVRINKEPRASIGVSNNVEGYREAIVEYWPNPIEVHVFGNYPNKSFNTENFPEVGTAESFAPVWGSGKQAYYDFQDGDYGWAAFNTTMAISDVFLLNSVRKGLGKAIMSKGLYGGTKRYFGIGMSHNYGASVSRWKKMGLPMGSGGSKDHWMFTQKLMEQYEWLKPIGNQAWNLKKFSSHAKHMRFGHGKAFPSLRLKKVPYWRFTYPIMATPTWFKAGVVSGGMRGFEYNKRNDN